MRKRWGTPLASAAVLWIAAGGARAGDESLKLSPCRPEGVKESVRCADLLVPENPRQPEGRRIKLHVVVLPALDGQGRGAPLFELAGGPGVASTGAAGFYATVGRIHRRTRDIVLIDQRGTGESSPLRCPELEIPDPSVAEMYPPEAVERCRQTLAKGADLSQYTTANTVADLDLVRSRLGYPKIDLFGLSYGTRLALAYLRTHPDRVRSAVLAGTLADGKKLPLWHARNAQTVLDTLFDQCAADQGCHDAYPELRREWDELLHRIQATPVRTTAVVAGRETPITLGAGPFAEAIRGLLYSAGDQIRIPDLVHRMSRGDFAPLLEKAPGGGGIVSEGLYLSITCAEDTPLITHGERRRATAGTFLGTYRIDEQTAACSAWNVPRAPDQAWAAPHPDVPVLLIAGSMDAVTAPAWSREVAALLPRSRVVEIPGLGHFPDGLEHPECFDAMMASFYESARPDAVDTGCVSLMTRPAFVLSR